MPPSRSKKNSKRLTYRRRKRSLRNRRLSKKRLGKKGGFDKKILEERKESLSPLLQKVDERTLNLLRIACGKQSAGICLDLGSFKNMVTNFFENFQNFELIDFSKVKRIGASSVNGFVLEVPFKKLDYTAYTVLKCSNNNDSDNLMYEYYVGKNFINKYIDIFPCFVETYGSYLFDEKAWAEASNGRNYNFKNTLEGITPFVLKNPEILWDFACENASYLSIMIQHFNRAISLKEMRGTTDIYNLLYQIYFPLSILQENYTHYDLHGGNVLLYKPFDGEKYVEMHYHQEDGTVISFKSEFIAKIIDYGRNFFLDKNNNEISSKKIIEDFVCKAEHCNIEERIEPYEKCGDETGFGIIHGPDLGIRPGMYHGESTQKYLDPLKRNHSADLTLVLEMLMNEENILQPEQNGLFDKFEYDLNFQPIVEAENTFSGEKKVVSTVQDMRDCLKLFLPEWNRLHSQKYANWTNAGELHVYADLRPTTFALKT